MDPVTLIMANTVALVQVATRKRDIRRNTAQALLPLDMRIVTRIIKTEKGNIIAVVPLITKETITRIIIQDVGIQAVALDLLHALILNHAGTVLVSK